MSSRQAWAGELPSVYIKLSALGRLGLERRFYLYSSYTDRKHLRDWPGVFLMYCVMFIFYFVFLFVLLGLFFCRLGFLRFTQCL